MRQIESKDLILSEKLGYLKLPVIQIARGKALQEWLPLSETSKVSTLVCRRFFLFEHLRVHVMCVHDVCTVHAFRRAYICVRVRSTAAVKDAKVTLRGVMFYFEQ
jgi:hypothetical protein